MSAVDDVVQRRPFSRRVALKALAGLALAGLANCGAETAPTVGYTAGSNRTPTAFGSQVYESDDVALSVGKLASLGAKYIRVSVQVAPAYLDALVAAATAKGLRVILLSAYAAQPVDLAGYARAAAQLHVRYAAADPIWEIWNEPNLAAYWNAPPDVGAYLAVLAAAGRALRAAGATHVWTGGTSGVDLNWIYNLRSRGAFDVADGCAVHSYKPPGYARTEYLQAVKLMPQGVGLHTTETCVASSSNQSAFFDQMWYLHRELGLPTMVWCELRDGAAGSAPPYNESYGLITSTYGSKGVYTAAAAALAAQH